MSLTRELVRDAPVGVVVTDALEGLGANDRPGCAAAIWRRPPVSEFQAWIDALARETLPSARVIVPKGCVRDAVQAVCEASGMLEGLWRARLVDDVALLAETFAALTGAGHLRLRLDPVSTGGCRRFHIDWVTARLICTYRGTGTQYGISNDGAAPDRVFTVPTGAPVVLRGTLCPIRPQSGLLHRSPPIEGTNETRLVLVLDPVHDPEDEA